MRFEIELQPGQPGADAGLEDPSFIAETDPAQAPVDPNVTYESAADARFATDSPFSVPDAGEVSGEGGMVSLWFQPEWSGENQDDASFVQIGDARLRLYKNVNFVRFEFVDAAGQLLGTGANISEWAPGEWHHMAMTWGQTSTEGEPVASLFVDGRLVGQHSYEGKLDFERNAPLCISCNDPAVAPVAPGVVSNVRVSKRSIPPAEVIQQFERTQPPLD